MPKEMTVREFASLGGLARARKMTPEQRQEAARKAVLARWAKPRPKYRSRKSNSGGLSTCPKA